MTTTAANESTSSSGTSATNFYKPTADDFRTLPHAPPGPPTSLACQVYCTFMPYKMPWIWRNPKIPIENYIHRATEDPNVNYQMSAVGWILAEWSKKLKERGDLKQATEIARVGEIFKVHPYDDISTYELFLHCSQPNTAIPDDELQTILTQLQCIIIKCQPTVEDDSYDPETAGPDGEDPDGIILTPEQHAIQIQGEPILSHTQLFEMLGIAPGSLTKAGPQ